MAVRRHRGYWVDADGVRSPSGGALGAASMNAGARGTRFGVSVGPNPMNPTAEMTGVYFYRIEAAEGTTSGRFTILR